jgi:sialic acid synthase SpsE
MNAMPQKPLFIFELANNHQGSVEHGARIIRAMREAAAPFADRFRFAVKFQYRDLDTFIHPAMRGRADVKHVKRFEETRLGREEFRELLACVRKNGFLAACTPFDEPSAARVLAEGFDYIKIASCSLGDWPLMEAVAETHLPVIASTAGGDMETVRNVVSFFANRGIPLALMHCVGEYPTPGPRMRMNRIDLFHREFPELSIGFSTHEAPDDLAPIAIAVAKGARIFEKHVGLPTGDSTLNAYSAGPEQVRAWLAAADAAFALCGERETRPVMNEREAADLAALRRGIFVRPQRLEAGAELEDEDIYFAFPCRPGQLTAQDFSKYTRFVLRKTLPRDAAVMRADVSVDHGRRLLIARHVAAITALLKESNAVVPLGSACALSHHYGLESYEKTGMALIDCVNREYCKKLLVLLPGQSHPAHSHVRKEETFVVLYGDLTVRCGDKERTLRRGETMLVERDTPHSFSTEQGCVFEELSSTHFTDDSYYARQAEFVSPRKTTVFLTRDVLGPWRPIA